MALSQNYSIITKFNEIGMDTNNTSPLIGSIPKFPALPTPKTSTNITLFEDKNHSENFGNILKLRSLIRQRIIVVLIMFFLIV